MRAKKPSHLIRSSAVVCHELSMWSRLPGYHCGVHSRRSATLQSILATVHWNQSATRLQRPALIHWTRSGWGGGVSVPPASAVRRSRPGRTIPGEEGPASRPAWERSVWRGGGCLTALHGSPPQSPFIMGSEPLYNIWPIAPVP